MPIIAQILSRGALPILVCALGTLAAPSTAQEIAFTWDDLPAHSSLPPGETRAAIGDRIITAWKAAKLPPVWGFVNGVQTEREPASTPMLAAWRKAGFPLGNHSWSHMNLNTNSVEAFEADVVHGEATIAPLMRGQNWHWFRYPNLAEGDTPEKKAAVRAFLADRGYRIAGVTMSFADYQWNEPYARCVTKHDDAAVATLERTYLAAADEDVTYTRAVFRSLYGGDIPYVLLMHVGALDSHMLPRLLALYRQRGFRFVTLEQAERHPYYRGYVDPRLAEASGRPEAQLAARGLTIPKRHDYAPELSAICRS